MDLIYVNWKFSQISEFNVAPSNNSQEHYASTIFKATVKYANKFNCEEVTKLLIKLVVPKAIAFSDENSFDTGNMKNNIFFLWLKISFSHFNLLLRNFDLLRIEYVLKYASGFAAIVESKR